MNNDEFLWIWIDKNYFKFIIFDCYNFYEDLNLKKNYEIFLNFKNNIFMNIYDYLWFNMI